MRHPFDGIVIVALAAMVASLTGCAPDPLQRAYASLGQPRGKDCLVLKIEKIRILEKKEETEFMVEFPLVAGRPFTCDRNVSGGWVAVTGKCVHVEADLYVMWLFYTEGDKDGRRLMRRMPTIGLPLDKPQIEHIRIRPSRRLLRFTLSALWKRM